MRAHCHVHGVELQQLYVPEQAVVVPGVDPTRRLLSGEPLGGEGDAAGFGAAKRDFHRRTMNDGGRG